MSLSYVSLFSGIEAASVAWQPLGWKALAFAEIEPFPCAVLAERFPDVPNLGDVSEVDWSPYHGTDVVVGGSPCQAFSVAGHREGLDDPRGRLMLEYVRAIRDIRPRWLVWENVPGVLSQDGGRAFATLLRELAECGYSLAWRVLDAQFFGVAQRRRRVFVVGGPTAGRAAAVLFEPGCVPGGAGQSKEKREALARAAGQRSGSQGAGCLNPWDVQSHRIYPPEAPSPSLCSAEKRDCLSPVVAYEGCLTPGENQSQRIYGVGGPAPTLGSRPEGTGDNTPTIAFKPNKAATSGSPSACVEQSPSLMSDTHVPAVAFKHFMGGKAGGIGYGVDVSPTLTDSSAHQPAVAFAQNTRDEVRLVNGDGQIAGALSAQPGMKQQTYVCMTDTQPHALIDADVCGALSATMHKDPPVVCDAGDWVVRRLTPLECERLQGFPDNWTAIPGAKDGPRYKAIGNSMAVPVMRWIGERIAEVDGEVA